MQKIIMPVVLSMLVSGCVFADTAKLEVFVVDETTEQPLANAEVTGLFSMRYGWSAVKGSPGSNVCEARTDSSGRCKLSGETNIGVVGCYVDKAPPGYYDHSGGGGYDFKRKDIFGVWQPDNLVVTVRVQRIENPIPLFVKKVGDYVTRESKEDLFSQADGVLRFDLMKGDWLPPIGKGKIADVEFKRLPHEDFGEFIGGAGVKGTSCRDSMEIRFLGEDNGLVDMSYSESARLKIRTAPDEGYTSTRLCWDYIDNNLAWKRSYDEKRCYCFRIRARRDEKGKVVEAYYGKIYGDIEMLAKISPLVPVASVRFTYYLNPSNLDRNLEWNKQNLCKEPIYPRPDCRNLEWEYESFNREQKP